MLKDYQETGVAGIIRYGGNLILADEPGLGKTIQVLTAIARSSWLPAVIVCPSTAKGVWVGEIREWLGTGVTIDVIEGKRFDIKPIADITIINYDILEYWRGYISGYIKPAIVVFDEGHALVNPLAGRTKAAVAIVTGRKLVVTGTPVLNIAYDLKQLQKICRSRVVIRRVKEEVLPDLPAHRRELVRVELDNRAEYEYAYGNFLSWLAAQGDREKLSAAIKAEGLVRVGYLKRMVARGKMAAVKQFAANFGEDKVIIFAVHREIVLGLSGGTAEIIDGTRTAKQRTESIRAFTEQEGCNRLVANIIAGGTAWNGTASNKVIVAELPWTYAKLEQAEKRIDRIGQTVPPVSYVLLGRATIEERFWELVEGKRNLSELLLGDQKKPWWQLW